MKFFELNTVGRDRLWQGNGLSIPGIICSACGATWAGCGRPYWDIPNYVPDKEGPIPDTEWNLLIAQLKQDGRLGSEIEVRPGDQIGGPSVVAVSPSWREVELPFPGQFIVNEDVANHLRSSSLSGFRILRAKVSWLESKVPPNKRFSLEEKPMYEINVTGTAWRVGVDLEQITLCNVCKRKTFPPFGSEKEIMIDESRWDGSDFFNIDRNPNIVFVTERVVKSGIFAPFKHVIFNRLGGD